MKAVAVESPGKVRVVDLPQPKIEPYEALARVHACGLCNGTDLKIIDDHISDMTVEYPVILGHEGVGEIIEVGSAVKNISVGDRFLNPSSRVDPSTGYNRMWGGMSGQAVVRDWKVMRELGLDNAPAGPGPTRKIPADIDYVDGAVLLSLKEALSALRNFGLKPGMDLLIYGDGPVGLALALFARQLDAGWIGVIGHRDARLARIGQVAAPDLLINSHDVEIDQALGDRLMDIVVDGVGSVEIIAEASHRCKPGGVVGGFGVLSQDASQMSLLRLKNNTRFHLLNFPYGEHETHEELVEMVLAGTVNPKDFYEHVLPVEQVNQAIDMVRNRQTLKAVLTFQRD
jgi:threonine dehydrogenase-like Zn-dependent dehydrogenase